MAVDDLIIHASIIFGQEINQVALFFILTVLKARTTTLGTSNSLNLKIFCHKKHEI
jgi:hypothetical protein